MNQEILEKISKYKRNEYGLLESVDYVLNEDGSINWRAMIPNEFLYVNKEWFTKRNKSIPESIDGLDDKQLLIQLGGIKELAKLRGFSARAIDYSGDHEYVTATCRIEWIGNYETSGIPIVYEDVANASVSNTDSFCHKFLETIAANRAFVRCVRNFLNIHIVGEDEIDKSEPSAHNSQAPNFLKPEGLLEKSALEKGLNSFGEFKSWLREQWKTEIYKNEDAKNWQQYSDIPPKESRVLVKILKS